MPEITRSSFRCLCAASSFQGMIIFPSCCLVLYSFIDPMCLCWRRAVLSRFVWRSPTETCPRFGWPLAERSSLNFQLPLPAISLCIDWGLPILLVCLAVAKPSGTKKMSCCFPKKEKAKTAPETQLQEKKEEYPDINSPRPEQPPKKSPRKAKRTPRTDSSASGAAPTTPRVKTPRQNAPQDNLDTSNGESARGRKTKKRDRSKKGSKSTEATPRDMKIDENPGEGAHETPRPTETTAAKSAAEPLAEIINAFVDFDIPYDLSSPVMFTR